MTKRILLSLTAMLVLLAGGASALAQVKANPAPLFTHVSEWGVPRAQWGEMFRKFRIAASGKPHKDVSPLVAVTSTKADYSAR